MNRAFQVARSIGIAALALFTALWLSAPAMAASENVQKAASCLAIVGGPTGQFAADLATGNSTGANYEKKSKAASRYTTKNCGAYSQNYVFLALAGALTTLVATKQLPDDYDAAKGLLDSFIAQIVADIIEAALSPDSPLHPVASALPDGWLDQLKNAIADGAIDKIKELLETAAKENPVFGQLLAFFDCGLVVATSGAAEEVVKAFEDGQNCGEFLLMCAQSPTSCLATIADLGAAIAAGIVDLPGDILGAIVGAFNKVGAAVDAVGGFIAGVGEGIQCGLNTCLPPGPQQEQENYIYACVPGWLKAEESYSFQTAKYSLGPPDCACNAPQGSKWVANANGTAYACTCNDPTLGYQGGACAACPAGTSPDAKTGACITCPPIPDYSIHTTATGAINGTQVETGIVGDNGQCVAKTCLCGKGDKPVVDPVTGACSCQSVCQPGSVYPSGTAAIADPNACSVCPANTRASQGQTGYDLFTFAAYQDQCVPCDSKTERSDPGSATCVPLDCNPKTHIGQNHQCVPCQGPGGQCIIGGDPVRPKQWRYDVQQGVKVKRFFVDETYKKRFDKPGKIKRDVVDGVTVNPRTQNPKGTIMNPRDQGAKGVTAKAKQIKEKTVTKSRAPELNLGGGAGGSAIGAGGFGGGGGMPTTGFPGRTGR
jgi:hypothetical protein